jgi:hypothetical protein
MNDNDITRNRKLIADVLMRPELREMRRKIQEAYVECAALNRANIVLALFDVE